MDSELFMGLNAEDSKALQDRLNREFADKLILQLARNPAVLPWDVIRATEKIMRERATMVLP